MDMNTKYGGFAAALINDPVWVMNVVSSYAANSLGVIYDRGLIGTVNDWLVFCISLFLLCNCRKVDVSTKCLELLFNLCYSGVKHFQPTPGLMTCFMLMVF
jgi:hypothetical protein